MNKVNIDQLKHSVSQTVKRNGQKWCKNEQSEIICIQIKVRKSVFRENIVFANLKSNAYVLFHFRLESNPKDQP